MIRRYLLSDSDFLTVWVTVESPFPSASERSTCRESILHELHVGAEAVVNFCENGKGRSHGFRKNCGLICKAPKHGHVLAVSKYRFFLERRDLPESTYINKRFDDTFRAVGGPAPRHNLFEVGVAIVERNISHVLRGQRADVFDVFGVFENAIDNLDRAQLIFDATTAL